MTGLGIKLFTDEDVDPQLAEVLCRMGYDALSCHVAGRANQRISDEAQLQFAVSQGRAILVFNIADYMAVDRKWRQRGKEHNGIILAEAGWSLSDLIRRAKCHLDRYTPLYQHNLVLYLDGCS